MKQTTHAMYMLIKAYRSILSHCFKNINMSTGGVKHNFSLLNPAKFFLSVASLSLVSSVNASVNIKQEGASLDSSGNLVISGELSSHQSFYSLTNQEDEKLSSIKSDGQIFPVIGNSVFIVNVDNSSLTVTGDVNISSLSSKIEAYDSGTYIFNIRNGGNLNLEGDIDIVAKHEKQVKSIGNNVFYATGENSKILIGSEGTTTKAWSIAYKPDVISAKSGATVEINSTNNQIVGSMDMMDNPLNTGNSFKKNTIKGVFSGENSYWFGDEQSWKNCNNTFLAELLFGKIDNDFDLTFTSGAQWSYFGISDEQKVSFVNIKTTVKRISEITLLNGGIINLYDENIQQTWKDLGLLDVFPELAQVNHDYVRIGNLKGNDGIFRLDLNADDKSQSDMVFVESSDDHGKFYVEPYNPEELTSITPTNTLRFATVSKDSGITFADSENLYGHTLYDYELVIDSEKYSKDDPENSTYEDKVAADDESLDFTDGDINWFIKRVIVKDSAASLAMTGAGYATYDSIVQLDRYDSRNTDVSRYAGETEGAWVRIRHGENGTKNQYTGDYTEATIGFDHYLTSSNRFGIAFSYLSGDVDFDDVNGSGDLTGYEGMIYDTQYFDNQYLDFVFRFGDLKNDFNAVNAVGAMPISTDYHQKYASLSAEYGLRYTDVRGVFFEPQAQFQLAYLADADYDAQRNMSADIDSAVSAIGRIGIRIGKSWELENGYTNDLYIRSDLLHQFTNGQDATYTDGTNSVDVTWGEQDTWCDLGVGGILHLGENFSMALDLSKSVGDDVTDTWVINGQARMIF